ncbi:MAG: hypothetical protein A4E42_00038 [Methanoregulaceae archaeon PtaU1.Bin222]|nr:MAG: hypothetical protein A4E42_00038 [Methanoregulaceae archaeon PtaU1.Bin222]
MSRRTSSDASAKGIFFLAFGSVTISGCHTPNHQSFFFPEDRISRWMRDMVRRNLIASSIDSVVSIRPAAPSIIFDETSRDAMMG